MRRAAITSSRACPTESSPGSIAKATSVQSTGSCMASLPEYAELHCLSNFSFLRGASHPEELVERAQTLGYAALALTDECSFSGIVRAHIAAKAAGLPLVIGSEVTLADGTRLVLLATDRSSYGDLSQLITRGRRSAE